MILKSLGIECSPVDIAAPGMENERDFMRENGRKKEGNRNVLPPQIFNDDKYCGVGKNEDNTGLFRPKMLLNLLSSNTRLVSIVHIVFTVVDS